MINIFRLFLLPTFLIPLLAFLTLVYPVAHLPNALAGIASLFGFSILSGFTIFAFVNLLGSRFFRIFVFFAIIILGSLVILGDLDSFFIKYAPYPNSYFLQFFDGKNVWRSLFEPILLPPISFLLAYLSLGFRKSTNSKPERNLPVRVITRIRVPLRFSELIKKDLLSFWRTYDAWLAMPIVFFYLLILLVADFSFDVYGIAISMVLLMNADLAFNTFGLEKEAGICRLSLFPLSSRDILVSKNKAFALLVLSQTFIVFPFVLLKFGVVFLLIATLKTFSIILLYTAWGNNLSVRYPFNMKFPLGGSILAMVYGALLISITIALPGFLISGNVYFKLFAEIAMISFSYIIYRMFLTSSAKHLSENWEALREKLR